MQSFEKKIVYLVIHMYFSLFLKGLQIFSNQRQTLKVPLILHKNVFNHKQVVTGYKHLRHNSINSASKLGEEDCIS